MELKFNSNDFVSGVYAAENGMTVSTLRASPVRHNCGFVFGFFQCWSPRQVPSEFRDMVQHLQEREEDMLLRL